MLNRRLVLAFMALAGAVAGCGQFERPNPEAIVGHWVGRASHRDALVHLSLDVERAGNGLRATLSSDDLMISRAPITGLAFAPPTLRFRVADPDAPVDFSGWLRGEAISGTLASAYLPGGASFADGARATFRRERAESLTVRADTLRFAGAAPGVTLAGTVFGPRDSLAHPAVVLVHGSSLNTRDSYLYYAQRFAREGFVALVYDKRGRGESSGDFAAATYDDLAADAAFAVAWLRARPDVDPKRVGIWGLSQGGMLAPRIAATTGAAFVVAISPPGLPLAQVIDYQDRVMGRRAPLTGPLWAGGVLQRDPAPDWRAVHVPVLVVFGERDVQVPAEPSAARIDSVLGASGNADATVRVFPRANHVIRIRPIEGEPFEWPRPAPGYLDLLLGWMRERAGVPPPVPPVASFPPASRR